VLVVIVLVGLLGWLAYKYGWPWLRQQRP
jgi:hypothetical protein